jgi:hypothetical protein
MTPPPPPAPVGPSLGELIEKAVAAISAFLLSQASVASILMTGYEPFPLSFYQLSIYDDYQWLLLIPAVVSLAAIYWVETSSRAFIWLFLVFIVGGLLSICVFKYFPARSELHFWNWILWNCLIAVALAIVLHIYLYLRRLGP